MSRPRSNSTATASGRLAGGQATTPALAGGYHLAFGVSAAIAGARILLAVTVLRPPAPPTANTGVPHDELAST